MACGLDDVNLESAAPAPAGAAPSDVEVFAVHVLAATEFDSAASHVHAKETAPPSLSTYSLLYGVPRWQEHVHVNTCRAQQQSFTFAESAPGMRMRVCTQCNVRWWCAHINIGGKPFACDFCDADFAEKYNLTVHRRTSTHTGVRVCALVSQTA